MEWISVKDRLPDDNEFVIMIEGGQPGMPVRGWYQNKGCIPGFYPSYAESRLRMVVTHWMPIPKTPTKDKK